MPADRSPLEVHGVGVAELGEGVALVVELEGAGVVGAQRPQGRRRVLVEEDRVGLGRVDDGLLPVGVDGRLGGRHHARAQLDALGPQGQRRGHGRSVQEAAGGHDGQVDLRGHQRQQHHGGHRAGVLEPAALATLHHQAVHARVGRLLGRPQGRHHVEDREAGLLELGGEPGGAAGRGGHEPHALVDHELDDRRIPDEGLGDVHAEGLVGQVAHPGDLVADHVELTRGRLDDAHGAGVGHGRGQVGPGDPAHGGLDDRDVDTQHGRDPVGEHGRILPWRPPAADLPVQGRWRNQSRTAAVPVSMSVQGSQPRYSPARPGSSAERASSPGRGGAITGGSVTPAARAMAA